MTLSIVNDPKQLIQLAAEAIASDQEVLAAAYLSKSLMIDPANASAYFLFAGLLAEQKQYPQAKEYLTKSLECDPMFHIARFELGLLHIFAQEIPEAEKVWQPLEELPVDNPIRLFKTGMLHLTRDEFVDCHANLTRGIELNTENLPLSREMEKILEQLTTGGLLAERSSDEDEKTPAATQDHLLASAYRGLTH